MTRLCLVGAAAEEGPRGGVQEATCALAQALRRSGVQVTLVAPSPDGPAEVRGDWAGIPVVRVGHRARLGLPTSFAAMRAALVSALDDLGPDIAQSVDVLGCGNAVADWSAARSLLTAHGDPLMDHLHDYGRMGAALRAPMVRRIAESAVRRAAAVVDVTPSWRVNLPVEPPNLWHIPNPLAWAFFGGRAVERSRDVSFFGGGRRIKGLDLLLEAWPAVARVHPEARLRLYGLSESEAEALRRKFDPADRVVPHAHVPVAEVARVMRRSAAVVVPSRFEVSPLVVAQAMATCTPVVATDVGGTAALADGCAALVRPEAASIAAGLLSVLGDPDQAAARAEAGGAAADRFRPDRVAAGYLAIYESVLATAAESSRTAHAPLDVRRVQADRGGGLRHGG